MTVERARYVPLFFIAGWLLVTTILAVVSGWFPLMARYPNRNEIPIIKLRWQSGAMGMGVNYNGLLTLSVCPSGLRIGMFRIFGPFCRDFFVPWEEVFIDRSESWLFGKRAKIIFGSAGRLTVFASVVDRLARALPERWPEKDAPAAESRRDIFLRFSKLWLLLSVLATTFLSIVISSLPPSEMGPPLAIIIPFPPIVFGLSFMMQYWFQARHVQK
jgi:hypothetical protein